MVTYSILILNFQSLEKYNENDLSQRWEEVRLKMRTRGNRGLSTRLFIIFMVLLMVFFSN